MKIRSNLDWQSSQIINRCNQYINTCKYGLSSSRIHQNPVEDCITGLTSSRIYETLYLRPQAYMKIQSNLDWQSSHIINKCNQYINTCKYGLSSSRIHQNPVQDCMTGLTSSRIHEELDLRPQEYMKIQLKNAWLDSRPHQSKKIMESWIHTRVYLV